MWSPRLKLYTALLCNVYFVSLTQIINLFVYLIIVWLFYRNQVMCVTFVTNVSIVRMSRQITCSCILARDHSVVHIVVRPLHQSQIWAPIWPYTQLMPIVSRLSFCALNVVRNSGIEVPSPCTGDFPDRFSDTRFNCLLVCQKMAILTCCGTECVNRFAVFLITVWCVTDQLYYQRDPGCHFPIVWWWSLQESLPLKTMLTFIIWE